MQNKDSKDLQDSLMKSLSNPVQKFTDAEDRCISRNIRAKVAEGVPMPKAIAASISICTRDKGKNMSEDQMIAYWKELSEKESGTGGQVR